MRFRRPVPPQARQTHEARSPASKMADIRPTQRSDDGLAGCARVAWRICGLRGAELLHSSHRGGATARVIRVSRAEALPHMTPTRLPLTAYTTPVLRAEALPHVPRTRYRRPTRAYPQGLSCRAEALPPHSGRQQVRAEGRRGEDKRAPNSSQRRGGAVRGAPPAPL